MGTKRSARVIAETEVQIATLQARNARLVAVLAEVCSELRSASRALDDAAKALRRGGGAVMRDGEAQSATIAAARAERIRTAALAGTSDKAATRQPAPDVQAALADALEQVEAALGDRLLGNGPLSKEYAHSVMRQINAALLLAGRKP